MEDRQMDQVISSIEKNIKKCDILNNVLRTKMAGEAIDFNWYYKRGYSEKEVLVGVELIDLYLKLRNYLSKTNDTR
ncbi:MAG: hypothetical protein GX340_05945 [Clostridiales bacterium]|nr:hypothetical protein [Clostridiales bacterium]